MFEIMKTPGDIGDMTPRQIVAELDKYVVGQKKAKKSVAIALRNRWRRLRVQSDLKDEILPNNIIMIGSTGVGKTEIARRLARLSGAPFVKVEASKFTEVGYVGRDVESMVRDLVELTVSMVKAEKSTAVEPEAERRTEEKLLDLLLPLEGRRPEELSDEEAHESVGRTRERLRAKLKAGDLDARTVDIEVASKTIPTVEIFSNTGFEEMEVNLQEAFGGLIPPRKKRRKVTVGEARAILFQQEVQKLVDMDKVVPEALERAQNSGIIFIDEIDKIAGSERPGAGPDVSREGVQRDILPVVEGCSVPTKYGMVKTDHILFIAAGAFHGCKPSDLIPELQGRFPIRVELDNLTEADFVRILVEPKNALIKQYQAMLQTEGVDVSFEDDAIREIARVATLVNEGTENIGARRLHTVLTTLLEEVLFEVPNISEKRIAISKKDVSDRLDSIMADRDLSRYIL